MGEMWKLVCFSVRWEFSFSRWVKTFGWSILICWSLVSGMPQIFFHMQGARILLDRRSLRSLEISNKEETTQKTALPLLFSRKRSKKIMNVADLSKEADSGDLAIKISFKQPFELCALCSKVLWTQHFQWSAPLQASLCIFQRHQLPNRTRHFKKVRSSWPYTIRHRILIAEENSWNYAPNISLEIKPHTNWWITKTKNLSLKQRTLEGKGYNLESLGDFLIHEML